MYQFKKSELADVYETCNVCKNNFKEANVENGRPIMPTDGTYKEQGLIGAIIAIIIMAAILANT